MSKLGTTTILGDLTVTGQLNTSMAIGLEDAITIYGEKTIFKDINNRFNALSFRNSNPGATAFSIMSFLNDTSNSGGIFFNSSARVDDGGPNSLNIYNDAGAINLRTPTEVYIKGGPLIVQGGTSGFREGLRLNENANGWVTLTMGGTAIVGSGETVWSLHKNNTGDFCICNNSSVITDGLGLYRNGSITWKNRHLAQMISANGYFGLIRPDNGDHNDWIRTTALGMIPYQSGGASSLGTAAWPFNDIFTKNLNATGIVSLGTTTSSSFSCDSKITAHCNIIGSDYYQANIEIREKNQVSNTQSDHTYAPSLGFHWGSRAAATIAMHSDGNFYFRAQGYSGSQYRNIYCNDLISNGAISASNSNGNVKRTTISTASPSGGTNGDIWIKYI